MGEGLGINTEGKHVIFAAGTGILPFMDLIAHLLLSVKQPELLSSHKVDPNSFKLVLYTSFLNEKEAVGLELIEALKSANPEIIEHHAIYSAPSNKQQERGE